VNQYTANEPEKVRARVRAEEYAHLLDQALGEIIPIIAQRGGYIFGLGHASISAAWAFPMFEDMFTRAVPAALQIQEALLKLGEEPIKSEDLAVKIGITGGWVCAATVGTSTHQSFGVYGPVVIEAASLSDIAEPGQTLVSHTIYERTKDEIVYDQVPGKSQSTERDIGSEYYLALRRR
jgi:class 3 adenylate cyclase